MKNKIICTLILLLSVSCAPAKYSHTQYAKKAIWHIKDGKAVDENGNYRDDVVVLSEESPFYVLDGCRSVLSKMAGNSK